MNEPSRGRPTKRRTWLGVLIESLRQFRQHHFDARSAQFAYYALFSIAPALIVIIAGVAQLPLQGVMESFLRAVDVGMPDSVVNLIEEQVVDIQDRTSGHLIGVGLFVLCIAGSRLIMTVTAGIEESFGGAQRRRPYWRRRLSAIVLAMMVSLILLVTLILLLLGPFLTRIVSRVVTSEWIAMLLTRGTRWTVTAAFMVTSLQCIYVFGPDLKVPWRRFLPGSIAATAGWVGVTVGFRFYVENFGSYNETYGALGGVVVLMTWLYLTGALLFWGGQLSALMHERIEQKRAPV